MTGRVPSLVLPGTYTACMLVGQVRADVSSVTTQGGILTECRPTRVGVLTYRYPDGSTRREYRPPEEVFAKASLATLAGAPLTVFHPKTNGGLITPKTYREENRGHICDDVRQDGDFVAVSTRVLDESTLDAVRSGRLSEMSAGYTCDIDPTPGTTPDGQPYDVVQRNMRYNHVALLPPGTGRAGREVGLRLDGAAYTADMLRLDDNSAVAETGKPAVLPTTVLDAKDFVPRSEYETVKGQLAAATARLTEMQTKLDAADATISPAALDKLVAARVTLVTRAKALLPAKTEFKTDGLSELEVMLGAIKLAKPSVKLDEVDAKSLAYVRGLFNGLADSAAEVKQAHGTVQEGVREVGRQDAKDQGKPVDYEAKIRAEAAERFNADMKGHS